MAPLTDPMTIFAQMEVEYLATRFTGVQKDWLLPGEYVGYLNGVPTVWGSTYTEAERRLAENIGGVRR